MVNKVYKMHTSFHDVLIACKYFLFRINATRQMIVVEFYLFAEKLLGKGKTQLFIRCSAQLLHMLSFKHTPVTR